MGNLTWLTNATHEMVVYPYSALHVYFMSVSVGKGFPILPYKPIKFIKSTPLINPIQVIPAPFHRAQVTLKTETTKDLMSIEKVSHTLD